MTTELDLVESPWAGVIPGLHEYLVIEVATGEGASLDAPLILGYPLTTSEDKAVRLAAGTPSQRASTVRSK